MHRHPGWELVWVERGQGECVTAKRSKTFCAGNAILIDGETEHTLRLYGGSFVRTLAHFDPALFGPAFVRETRLFADLPRIGYTSPFAFSRAFKRYYGVAPSLAGQSRRAR